ncbi:MAG TPA: hypothetical protein PKM91_14135 [Cyclobacteriaceae bacterium]|nr:hypothetical protein [Cytophagales bacterium]HNP78374.1 hypothetical protein [Cyclobacteriaceae bacterium]
MKFLTIVFLYLSALGTPLFGQSGRENLTWSASKIVDEKNNRLIDNSYVFNTSVTRVTMIQKNNYTLSFDVTGVDGSWTDVATPGKIAFAISDGDDTGTLTIQRSTKEITIVLDFSQGASGRLVRKFIINSVQRS